MHVIYSIQNTECTLAAASILNLIFLYINRRFIWNFFRLENEHLNNCGQFRAVRDISIAPIDSNDQSMLEKLMDEPDGVVNRRRAGDKQKLLPGSR